EGGTTRSASGAGLGLAIAKAFIEAHQGEIGVESRPGQGSTFWLALPWRSSSAVEAPDDSTPENFDRALG
ncbi:MAG: hypothetical protein KGR26_16215, partial [Cyanobacteria bacterium REEB65]|nr:hypothetical protein [Cyanobacteria bacterium REEB65]